MNTYRLITLALACLASAIGLSAQDGENALIKVSYSHRFHAVDNSTKDPVMLSDTLVLVAGQTKSVFLNPLLEERSSAYFKRNRARANKITVQSSMAPVPYESIRKLIPDATDYEEADFGCIEQIHKDRASMHIENCLMFGEYLRNGQDALELSSWKTEDGEMKILGYDCRKASVVFGGRQYYAWYTLDIPVSDGPWKLMGLPGLILKAEDADGMFCYEAIGLEKAEGTVPEPDESFETCSRKDYLRASKKNRTDIKMVFIHKGRLYISSIQPYSYTEQETDSKE